MKYRKFIIIAALAINMVLMGKMIALASQNQCVSKGNIVMQDQVGIYEEDFVYLQEELNRLFDEMK